MSGLSSQPVVPTAEPGAHGLAGVLGSLCSAGQAAPTLATRLRGAITPVHLQAAVALAQSRLTGQRRLRLRVVGTDGQARTPLFELDDTMAVGDWLEAIAGAGGAEHVDDEHDAELALGAGCRIGRPDDVLAAVSVVDDRLMLEVDRDRVDALGAGALLESIQQACEQLSGDRAARCGTLSVLGPGPRANLLCRFQSGRAQRPRGTSLPTRLGEIAGSHPSAPAVRHGRQWLSYQALWTRSGRIAAALVERGIGAGDVVAVHGPRCIEQLLAVVAIVRAGAAYVALDPGAAAEQTGKVLAVCNVRCVIVAGAARAPSSAVECIPFDALQPATEPPPLPSTGDADRVCLLPSAGPGGSVVSVGQRSILRMAGGGIGGSRTLCAAPLSLDRSLFEVWVTLLDGGICVLPEAMSPAATSLSRTIAEHDVELAILPPSIAERLTAQPPQLLSSLRRLLITDGAGAIETLRQVQQRLPKVEIVSLYSAVGCPVMAASLTLPRPIPEHWRGVPIGQPIAETALHVLAGDGGLLPVGAVGEIHVGGAGLALGCVPETRDGRASFVADPFGSNGDRLYRTGDFGRRLPDGCIESVPRRPTSAGASRSATDAPGASVGPDSRTTAEVRQRAPLAAQADTPVGEFIARYRARTAGSLQYAEQHGQRLADRRPGATLAPLAYPLVIERSHGCRVWDIDGNEYIDVGNGFGSNLFGWQPGFVVDALRRQLERGYGVGPQHPMAGDVAERLCRLTGFDRAVLCGSELEAMSAAVRIARSITGRRRVVTFTGSSHGIFDGRAGGQRSTDPALADVQLLDFGSEQALAAVRNGGAGIAAVLVEPVRWRFPAQRSRQFLCSLIDEARSIGALVIFDERVTGFRCAPGGAREYFAVEPDLAVYGRNLAAGMPIGAIAGRRECIDATGGPIHRAGADHDRRGDADEAGPGGSLMRHPLALAAASAVLARLQLAGPGLQNELNACTADFVAAANRRCRHRRAPIELRGFASWWTLQPTVDSVVPLLWPVLRAHGIHALDGFPCFMSAAHRAADRQQLLDRLDMALAELDEIAHAEHRDRSHAAIAVPLAAAADAVGVRARRPPSPSVLPVLPQVAP